MNYNKQQEELIKIQQRLYKLYAQKNLFEYSIKNTNSSHRKARTRTLIQIGGILSLTPLLNICNIEVGEDLQDKYDKKNLLLGLLTFLSDQIPTDLNEQDIKYFITLGETMQIKKQSVK